MSLNDAAFCKMMGSSQNVKVSIEAENSYKEADFQISLLKLQYSGSTFLFSY